MNLTGGKPSGGSRAKRGKDKNKYNAQKIGGYDSKKEYRRACILKALLRSGEISDLREQVKYVVIPTQRDSSGKLLERECSYYADFVYQDKYGNLVVEDTKGVRTPEYRLKKKLMLLVYGIHIKEI
ncbi:MAG: DUF1064 domain-containing protein [Bacteroides sp.]|nr:DUF1064 domain-containing protein [Bacteroides sp.]